MVGRTAEELIGQSSRILYPDDEEFEFVGKEKYRQIHECDIGTVETRWQRKDGSILNVLLSSSPIDPTDLSRGVTFTAQDITERKRTESRLRMTRFTVEHSSDAVYWADEESKIYFVNDAACQSLGYTRQELLNMAVVDIDPDMNLSLWRQAWSTLRYMRFRRSGFRHQTKDGRIFPVEITANYVPYEGREYVCAFARDITDRREAERALRESEKKFRNLVQSTSMGIHMYELRSDNRLVFVDYNPRGEPDLGGRQPGLRREGRRGGVSQFERHGSSGAIPAGSRARGTAWHREDMRYVDDQIQGVFEVRAFPTSKNRMAVIFTDVTERKRAELAMRESEENYRTIFNGINEAIFICEPETGRVVDVNFPTLAMFGITRDQALRPNESAEEEGAAPSIPEQIAPRIREAVEERTRWFKASLTCSDNTPISVGGNAQASNARGKEPRDGRGRDITERENAEATMHRMEAHLTHVARLSAMGELVAGVAHEINQPLYSIANYSKACRNILSSDAPPDLEEIRNWSEQIALAASRAGDILKRIRGFVRRTDADRGPIQLIEVVRDAVALVQFQARERRIDLRVDVDPLLPDVAADRVQIQQVLVNLLTNAFEAIDEANCTERIVHLRAATVGDEVAVSVTDTGPGLPAGDNTNIFDAFTTTKRDGLGMGLAISRTIVETHGGRLEASSSADGGAVFHFSLPTSNREQNHVECP